MSGIAGSLQVRQRCGDLFCSDKKQRGDGACTGIVWVSTGSLQVLQQCCIDWLVIAKREVGAYQFSSMHACCMGLACLRILQLTAVLAQQARVESAHMCALLKLDKQANV
jgi:hypothetical protein